MSEECHGFASTVCPRCGEDGEIRLALDDVQTFTCSSCEQEFTAVDVQAIIASWAPILAWIALAPVREE